MAIVVIADPLAQFLMAFVVEVVDGLEKVVESGDTSAIFWWTRKLTIGADQTPSAYYPDW